MILTKKYRSIALVLISYWQIATFPNRIDRAVMKCIFVKRFDKVVIFTNSNGGLHFVNQIKKNGLKLSFRMKKFVFCKMLICVNVRPTVFKCV